MGHPAVGKHVQGGSVRGFRRMRDMDVDQPQEPPDGADQAGSDQRDAECERLQHIAQHPTDGRQRPEQDVYAQDQSEQSAGDHDEPDNADHGQQPRPDRERPLLGTSAVRAS